MNRKLASILSIASTSAAILAAAAISSGNAYADDITVDNTPFVSTKTRAEVQAEVMGRSEQLRIASSEEAMQSNHVSQPSSSFTRAQATAEYIAARDQVKALNSEDSGSSYFAAAPRSTGAGVIMAGSQR